jgi:hypothetical protein
MTREAVQFTTAGKSMASVLEPTQHNEGFKQVQGRLRPGNTIFVTDRQGREVTGKLTHLSPASLVIVVNGNEREILFTDIGWIEKRGGIGRGTLIATGLSAWLGMVSVGTSCSPNCAGRKGLAVSFTFWPVSGCRRQRHHQIAAFESTTSAFYAELVANIRAVVKTGSIDQASVSTPAPMRELIEAVGGR